MNWKQDMHQSSKNPFQSSPGNSDGSMICSTLEPSNHSHQFISDDSVESMSNAVLQSINSSDQTVPDSELIDVVIDCGAGFLPYTNNIKHIALRVSPRTTFLETVGLAGIPVEKVGFISVNGTKKEKEDLVSDQDTIRPLPYIISG
jgi:hypothetical protein